jgi:hypothetical protein
VATPLCTYFNCGVHCDQCGRGAAYYLPEWVPGSEYVRLAKELGLKDVRTTDWSEFVVSDKLCYVTCVALS